MERRNGLTHTASSWLQWSPAALAAGRFLTDDECENLRQCISSWAYHPDSPPPARALLRWAVEALVLEARLDTGDPQGPCQLAAAEVAARGREACRELRPLAAHTGDAAIRAMCIALAEWWREQRETAPQPLAVDAVEVLLARAVDQLAGLLVFANLSHEEDARQRGLVWRTLVSRVCERIILPQVRPMLRGVAAEHQDLLQACCTALYDRARTPNPEYRFTYTTLGGAHRYFTSAKFGRVVLRMLTPPPPKTAAQPGASVTPVAALPPTLEDPAEVAARQQEAAMTWAQTQRACPTRKTAIQAWFLSYWRDDRHYKMHNIAAELGKPACGQLLDQLDESEWPPGVSRQEAQHALHGMTKDAIRQVFSRYDKDLVLIRWPTKPKLPMWKCMVTRLGEPEAIRFWTLMQLIEDRTSNLDPDSVAEIVQRFAALGRQGGPASARGGAPPDARVHEQHRPPRVSWASVAQAFGQLRPEMLTAEALYNRYATFWTHVVSALQQAR